MQWLHNLKVKKKLFILMFVFICGLISIGVMGFYYLRQANENFENLYQVDLKKVEHASQGCVLIREIQGDMFLLMSTTYPEEEKKLMGEINNLTLKFDETLKSYEQLPLNSMEQGNLKELRDAINDYRVVKKRVIELATTGQDQAARQLYRDKGEVIADDFVQHLNDMTIKSQANADEMAAASHAAFQQAKMVFILFVLCLTVIGLILGSLIIRQIVTRLNDAVDFLDEIATGDFSRDVSAAHSLEDHSEFGRLSRSIDQMNKHIRALIKNISTTAENLASASEELSATAEQSAQASEQVAQSIITVAKGSEKQLHMANETSLTIEEMAKGIQQVAQNSMVATQSAEKTSISATSGGSAIEQTIDQMKVIEQKTDHTANVISELDARSQQIGQIVEAITTIADQTNLLALNAAIEAARAGEAGRGFSVVAEEVRKLAEQSAQSAKEITELIHEIQERTNSAVSFMNDSKKEVKTGAEVAILAGENFAEILTRVSEITDQIHEISAASQELTSGTDTVVMSAHHTIQESEKAAEETESISAATEQQSAAVEEIATASKHLADMAMELQNSILKFKV
ncbi:methyl-accepting chemotaxis protein [Propionispira arboris]|uniref:Methyl-accepting chemotaxis protein n=1 Tax=Propionispira arboris TaxID=84035 RepID=A0A1H6W0Q7_9FIRM|nr:methyl-accepting chemotaxis protein [Propionispira arboris]SEJ06400.1 methyl-accepting chemotaxis protein [Propionispira arboris]